MALTLTPQSHASLPVAGGRAPSLPREGRTPRHAARVAPLTRLRERLAHGHAVRVARRVSRPRWQLRGSYGVEFTRARADAWFDVRADYLAANYGHEYGE